MRFTVRCLVDGVVEVSVRDLDTVVVRSGSDVEATYRCPMCGSPIRVAADLAPEFVAWAVSRGLQCGVSEHRTPRRKRETSRDPAGDEASIELFRRELAEVRTVEDVIARAHAGDRGLPGGRA